MKIFLKYLLWFLSFLTILFFYLLNTRAGNIDISRYLSSYLSKKTNSEIKVYYLNFKSYPKLEIKMQINKTSDLQLKGVMDEDKIAMRYHLVGDSLKINSFIFQSRIDMRGNLSGSTSKLYITGKGGVVTHKKSLPITFNGKIIPRGHSYDYKLDTYFDVGKIHFTNGTYNNKRKTLYAEYTLHINDLEFFERELKHKYTGSFNAKGLLSYNKGLKFDGDTDKFGGNLHFYYDKDDIELRFKNISLVKILKSYNYPILLKAKVFGKADYHAKNDLIVFDTKLKQVQFIKSKITDTILDKTKIDMLRQTYNHSSFEGAYRESRLFATLKIDDGHHEHLYLRDIRINSKTQKLNSQFEIRMQNQEFFGKIYGTLEKPEISLNISRFMQYQLRKGIGSFLGIKNSREIKKSINKIENKIDDIEVRERAKSLLNDFF
jgi:hypothetical protein